jgi:preprotein translocase subunit SecA
MLLRMLSQVFGSKNERELKRMRKTVSRINTLEEDIEKLSAEELIGQREKLQSQILAGDSLEDILPEAFATVREAGKRALGLRLFDVQMIGGITLHEGRIAEMRTGEGKNGAPNGWGQFSRRWV